LAAHNSSFKKPNLLIEPDNAYYSGTKTLCARRKYCCQ
jgi:hypothetical protein